MSAVTSKPFHLLPAHLFLPLFLVSPVNSSFSPCLLPVFVFLCAVSLLLSLSFFNTHTHTHLSWIPKRTSWSPPPHLTDLRYRQRAEDPRLEHRVLAPSNLTCLQTWTSILIPVALPTSVGLIFFL